MEGDARRKRGAPIGGLAADPAVMSRPSDLVHTVSLVSAANQARPQLAHRLDGRYEPMSPAELTGLVKELVRSIDVSATDAVLGLPEGGVAPAFVFAQLTDRPLILSTRLQLALPGGVSFEEPHSGLGTTHQIYGLRGGGRIVLIEDEVTTGRTVINVVRALRKAGIRINEVGSLLVVDDPAMWRAMSAERIRLSAVVRLRADVAVPSA
jgi:orotate phosphoribosyltransferase